MITHKHIIIGQIVFLLFIIGILYIFYPRVEHSITGDVVKFNSENSQMVIFSQNPDFSNPKYINFDEEEQFLKLSPGTYYWKPANNFITGFSKSITIDSEVVLEIRGSKNNKEIKNIGNVKINVTKSEDGVMTGNIILEPEQSDNIIDSGEYTGREE